VSNSKTCFIISPIGEENTDTRKRSDQVLKHIIEPTVKQFGYSALRADRISKPGVITSQIIQHILEDPLVIADLTENNPNVFYELAVRHATRKPVILIREVGQRVPFDVAQNRAIELDYQDLDSVDDCKKKLAEQCRSIEKEPTDMDNPISATIDLQNLRKSGDPSEKRDAQIIAILQDVRTGVAALANSLSHPKPAPVTSAYYDDLRTISRLDEPYRLTQRGRVYFGRDNRKAPPPTDKSKPSTQK
jgi:hypothetical protein